MPREHPESTVCGFQGTRPGIRTVDSGPGRHKKRGDEQPSPRCSPRMYVFDYGLDVMKIRVPSRVLQANFIIGSSETLSRHCHGWVKPSAPDPLAGAHDRSSLTPSPLSFEGVPCVIRRRPHRPEWRPGRRAALPVRPRDQRILSTGPRVRQ